VDAGGEGLIEKRLIEKRLIEKRLIEKRLPMRHLLRLDNSSLRVPHTFAFFANVWV
jgi:hypothetical protein